MLRFQRAMIESIWDLRYINDDTAYPFKLKEGWIVDNGSLLVNSKETLLISDGRKISMEREWLHRYTTSANNYYIWDNVIFIAIWMRGRNFTADFTQQHVPHQASFYISEVSASSNLSSCSNRLSSDLYLSPDSRVQLLWAPRGFYVGKAFDYRLGVLLELELGILV